ncbi:MAG: acyl-CoA dehydrogenase [Alphaproteobacteria bacterium]|nr:acyl-CoA dehydrogenase [Alphaproteobacteria bacterium]
MFKALRRTLVTGPLMGLVRGTLPQIGDTERIALEAGTTWFEAELFRGNPDFTKLLAFPVKPLTAEEQAFLAGPVEELCAMVDDWEIEKTQDLPKKVWDFIKQKKFLGMIIPKEYGGLGFSAAAHAAVVTKIASRSVATAVTVMVPNSLGPGELLMRYGTQAQKDRYLKKLAVGEEIPCFGLTEPEAGSDAASGQSFGVVGYKTVNGKKELGVFLTFNKRYITLAPIATVVGLAFRLNDPDNVLGKGREPGITLALLPRSTKGLEIGRRHDPMGVGFMNGPLSGKDVFVPLETLIGGAAYAGQGWRMLMEALAAGRGISLPSLSVGAAQLSLRAAANYSVVRRQFGLNIGRFEGIRERLARLAGHTYAMTATQRLTAGAVDAGEHPAVVSAIAKAYLTENMRLALNDAMDIQAGAAIIRGPRNIFARPYSSIPIGITVEGANILTRSLIVFGQGAIRCHPYLQAEVEALTKRDKHGFDEAFMGHLGYLVTNIVRAKFHAWTCGWFVSTPKGTPFTAEYKHLGRLSAAFSVIAEAGLITLGGSLKRKEYLSGRYADALAHLFIASSVLKFAHDNGNPPHHLAAARWALRHSLREVEQALLGVIANLPNRLVAGWLRLAVLPCAKLKPHTDAMHDAVVDELLSPNGRLKDDLSRLIFIPAATHDGLGKLEAAYQATVATAPLLAKLPKGVSVADGLAQGLLTKAEAAQLAAAQALRTDVVQVDAK